MTSAHKISLVSRLQTQGHQILFIGDTFYDKAAAEMSQLSAAISTKSPNYGSLSLENPMPSPLLFRSIRFPGAQACIRHGRSCLASLDNIKAYDSVISVGLGGHLMAQALQHGTLALSVLSILILEFSRRYFISTDYRQVTTSPRKALVLGLLLLVLLEMVSRVQIRMFPVLLACECLLAKGMRNQPTFSMPMFQWFVFVFFMFVFAMRVEELALGGCVGGILVLINKVWAAN